MPVSHNDNGLESYRFVDVHTDNAEAMAWVNDMWCTSMRNEGGWARAGKGTSLFNVRQRQLINQLVDGVSCETVILVHPEDDHVFLGFACGELLSAKGGVLLHYVAVKSSMRQAGLSHVLLDQLYKRFPPGGYRCSHITKSWIKTPRGRGMTYDPYLLLGLEIDDASA